MDLILFETNAEEVIIIKMMRKLNPKLNSSTYPSYEAPS